MGQRQCVALWWIENGSLVRTEEAVYEHDWVCEARQRSVGRLRGVNGGRLIRRRVEKHGGSLTKRVDGLHEEAAASTAALSLSSLVGGGRAGRAGRRCGAHSGCGASHCAHGGGEQGSATRMASRARTTAGTTPSSAAVVVAMADSCDRPPSMHAEVSACRPRSNEHCTSTKPCRGEGSA